MGLRVVWAYKRLEELDNAVGFVTIDADLAAVLIESGDVQEVNQGQSTKPIDYNFPEPDEKAKRTKEYETKELTARKKAAAEGQK